MNNPLYIDQYRLGQTPNPWFNVANQFLPRNLHDIIRWSRFILLQSPTTTEVLRKFATYPITKLEPGTQNKNVIKKFEKIVKSLHLRQKLNDIGFDLYSVGNVFVSIYFPIIRSVKCETCSTVAAVKSMPQLKFQNFKYVGPCPACGAKSPKFTIIDIKSNNIDDINLIKWSPTNISVHHNPITGESEYYYTIPNDIRNKILLGDRLFVDTVQWEFIEAVRAKKDFKFSKGGLFHLKDLSMGSMIEGLGIPRLIPLFSIIFYQALLRKANEAIATEHLVPLRVLSPAMATQNGDPVISASLRAFAGNMENAIRQHKHDPNHFLVAPYPVNYQVVGGEGKALMLAQELQASEQTMFLGLGVSQELLSGTTNWTSSTVGLRLLENSMRVYLDEMQELVSWTFDKIFRYLGIDPIEVKFQDFKLTDNDMVKSLFSNLAQSENVSMTTLFESIGFSYKDELDRIRSDAVAKARMDIELQREVERVKFEASRKTNSEGTNESPAMDDARTQAKELASQLQGMPASQRSTILGQVYKQDEGMYNLIMEMLPHFGIDQTSLGDTASDGAAMGGIGEFDEKPPVPPKPEEAPTEEGDDAPGPGAAIKKEVPSTNQMGTAKGVKP